MNKPMTQASIALTGLLLAGTQAVADDCTLGERYVKRAEAARAAYDDESRIRNLQLATEACGDATMWLTLADAIMEVREAAEPWLGVDAESAEDGFAVRASAAYSKANEFARTPEQSAAAMLGWSRVAFYEVRDPERAEQAILEAEQLAPENAEIAAFASELRSYKPNREEMVRGLRESMLMPLAPSNLPTDLPQDEVFASSGGSGGAAVGASGEPGMRSISQDIVFRFGSTDVEDVSVSELRELAAALASEELAGENFLVVGHADARGDAATNLRLSQARARSVERQLVLLEPSLSGRIEADGLGEEQPVYRNAMTEEQHRANRRLEVRVH